MRDYIDQGFVTRLDERAIAGINASSYLASETETSTLPRIIRSYAKYVVPVLCLSGTPTMTQPDATSLDNSFKPIRWDSPSNQKHIEVLTQSVLYAELSGKLQQELGFRKVAPWARVLHVERKTIYDWRKRPETDVQPRIAARLDALKCFCDEIEPEHRRYVSTMAFSRWSDQDFAEALLSEDLNNAALVNHYDRLFIDFVGLDKRSRLNRA